MADPEQPGGDFGGSSSEAFLMDPVGRRFWRMQLGGVFGGSSWEAFLADRREAFLADRRETFLAGPRKSQARRKETHLASARRPGTPGAYKYLPVST